MTSLLTESTLTPQERAAVDDHPRPGVWAGQIDADLRDLTQEETDMLIRSEIWSAIPVSDADDLHALTGYPWLIRMPELRPHFGPQQVLIGRSQRGGIDTDPMVRLLAYRAWGDRDRKWPGTHGSAIWAALAEAAPAALGIDGVVVDGVVGPSSLAAMRRLGDPVAAALSKIRSAITPFVYRVRSEAELQDAVCHALDRTSDLTYEREVSIGSLNRYDILVRVHAYGDDGRPSPTAKVVVELKLRAPAAAVERQVQRYALVPDVDAVMVATTSNRLAAELSLSPTIGCKPFSVVALRTS